MIHADILSDDYLEIQELRQIIVGEVLVFAEGIKSMTLSKPKDGNVLLEFKDLVTTLNRFPIDPVNLRGMSIFCGQIHFN